MSGAIPPTHTPSWCTLFVFIFYRLQVLSDYNCRSYFNSLLSSLHKFLSTEDFKNQQADTALTVQNYVREVPASSLDRTPPVLTEISGGFPSFLYEYSSTVLLSDRDSLLLFRPLAIPT